MTNLLPPHPVRNDENKSLRGTVLIQVKQKISGRTRTGASGHCILVVWGIFIDSLVGAKVPYNYSH